MKQQKQDWHAEDIKAEIRKRGLTVSALSKLNGYRHGALSVAIRKPWVKGEQIIAHFLGEEPETIWPSRYYRDGKKIIRRTRRSVIFAETPEQPETLVKR